MPKLGIGIIGAGGIAVHAHIPGYQKLSNVEILGVSDVNYERAKDVAAGNGIPKAFKDYNEMLAMPGIDAVSVCTPNAFHAPATIAALKAGKHVLCEKPMAISNAEAQQMVDTARASGKKLMIGFHNRFRNDAQRLHQMVQDGKFGEIYFAKAGMIRRRGIPGLGGWFTTKKLSGGGALMDIGVHILDLSLWVMGWPEVTSVSGITFAKFGNKPNPIKGGWGEAVDGGIFDVDDFAAAYLRFKNGGCMFVETCWAANIEKTMTYISLLGDQLGSDIEPLRIYGEWDGVVVDSKPQMPQMAGGEAHALEIAHFVDCVINGKEVLSPAEHGLKITNILQAIDESSREGKEIILK